MEQAVQGGVEAAFDHLIAMILLALLLFGIGRTFRHSWENARDKKRQRRLAEQHSKKMWALAQQERIGRMRQQGGFWGRFGWRMLPRTFDEQQELNRQLASLVMVGLIIVIFIALATLSSLNML